MARPFSTVSQSKLIHATHALVKVLDRLNVPTTLVDALTMDEQSTLVLNLTEMNAIPVLVCKTDSSPAQTIPSLATASMVL